MTLTLCLVLSLFALSNAGLTPRIINGTVALPGEIPYQVALQTLTKFHFCGGSILNNLYVITAAHCVEGKSSAEIIVVAGTVDLELPGLEYGVEKIYIHEKYNSSDAWVNDIALLKVKNSFVQSAVVSFVPMPSPDDIAKTGDTAIVSGFGRLAYGGERTNLLHWAKIIIADQAYCRKMYGTIYNTHLCAYDPTSVKGSCKGDSGGPLMVNGALAGIVSWSYHCADMEYPTVYTRVTSYLGWIKEHSL